MPAQRNSMTQTPLEAQIIDRIASHGDLRLDHFMDLCLFEPTHGYYASRHPIGAPHSRGGDFVTSPEISQIFGELIGAWCLDLWQRHAAAERLHLIEIGPGRGTLAGDIWRTICQSGHEAHIQMHLVETSPSLRSEQAQRVPQAQWHNHLETVPHDAPSIVIANEFFDALPIRQFLRTDTGWAERYVTRRHTGFEFIEHAYAPDAETDMAQLLAHAAPQTPCHQVIEICPAAMDYIDHIGSRLHHHGGAVLAIDYGYGSNVDRADPASDGQAIASAFTGDSLQGMRQHRFVSPLSHIGEADLTAHVNFDTLRSRLRQAGCMTLPLLTQGTFLKALGIEVRAEQLVARHPHQATSIREASTRLTSPTEMGQLFKVLCATSANFPVPAPFVEAGARVETR